jgi:hypothetical protein
MNPDRMLLLAVCFALPLLARLYALRNPLALSVDEAEWTVSARGFFDDPVVWRSTDMTTSGPLNAFALTWPKLFGLIPSIITSRFTGLVLQSASLFGIATILRRGELVGPASAAILLSAATLALSVNPNFIHASSEIVPVTLMVVFCVTLARLQPLHGRSWQWAVCGLTATCLPFAKLQSAPICLLFHAMCVGRLLVGWTRGQETWRHCLAYIAAAAAPALIFIAPLYVVGEAQAFWTGYLGLAAGYVGNKTLEVFRIIFPQIVIDAALMWWVVRRMADSAQRAVMRWDLLLLGFFLWPVMFVVIWLPGRPFYHYDLYALIGMPLAVTLAQRALPLLAIRPAMTRFLPVALIALVACLATALLVLPDQRDAFSRAATSSAFDTRGNGSRALMDWTGVHSQDRLFMWGWEPDITAYADLKSGDRASQGEYLIRPNPGRPYFRDRLLKDWSNGEPALIMDAVRPPYFFTNYAGINATDYNIRSFPAIDAIVSRDYRQIAGDENCAALYLRDDLARALRDVEIPLRSTAPQLVDGSVTEKCGDWWAPDPAHASATLTLRHPERVAALWVLASRGGPPQKLGTTRIRVTFVGQAGDRRAATVTLFDYPRWTVIPDNDRVPLTSIVIDTLGYVGEGPALNEVKAFRKQI